jgi:hypothetical protein
MGTDKQQTAVEWLVEKLYGDNQIFGVSVDLLNQAIEMEKEQVENAYYTGAANFSEHSTKAVRWSKQYYNETFKK